jgi:type IV pilus assembly protein PilB
MSINSNDIKRIIEQSKLVSKSDFTNAVKVSQHLGCSVIDVLLGRELIKEEDLGKLLSKFYTVPYIDLRQKEINFEILNLIPEEIASQLGIVAFNYQDNNLSIALENPRDLESIEVVKKIISKGNRISLFVTTPLSLKAALKLYQSTREEKDIDIKNDVADTSAVSLIEKLLENAIREEASDIHIEPLDGKLLIRYRIDGVLQDVKILPINMHAPVVARIKILSDLKLDEQRLPQDGQFSIISKREEKISFRVSTLPTVWGEKVVLRLLENALTRFNLEELGLLPEDQDVVGRILERTHGMLLVTGPTGSGKTTSLYTILGLLNKPDVNIITIEDPVENRINRINQIQVNHQINLSFASGLRSVLRQDPDIIMVGEIRDKETAVIATNAAMTGHLVFSTVHANTSSGAIPRMIDLGVEPFLLASTLNLVIAQRLVRVLCPKCKREIALNPVIKKKLLIVKDNLNSDIYSHVKYNYEAPGCTYCYNTGFRGRIGIFEILAINENIRDQIVNKSPSNVIWNIARELGAKTMLEDGLIKVTKGMTTMEEVFRVISE